MRLRTVRRTGLWKGHSAHFFRDVSFQAGLLWPGDERKPIQPVALPEKTLALEKVGTEGGAQSVIEGRKVMREHLPDKVPLMQIDQEGGYSAACASLVHEGGAWPEKYTIRYSPSEARRII